MKTARYLLILLLSVSVYAQTFAQTEGTLKISHLTGNFYVYTTWHNLDGSPYPANSMYLVTNNGVVMFDTPWDSTQFQPLLDSIYARHHAKVVMCISTHFHADRTIGLEFLKQHGIKTYTSQLTHQLSIQHGEKLAEYHFIDDSTFSLGGYTFQTYYPGKGHTADNIVIWFPKQKILYGGCFIKSTETQDIGNIEDADVGAWPASVKRVMAKFPGAEYVIPGHLGWADGAAALQHTLSLAEKANK